MRWSVLALVLAAVPVAAARAEPGGACDGAHPCEPARVPSPAELRQARELFAHAERDERAGDWTAALGKLRHIETLKATAGIRFHIALCEENVGLLAAALEDYAIAEKRATDEKNREVLAALKEPMAELRARVPRLVVRVPPDVKGVAVTVDGKPLSPGYFGAELPADPRAHGVEATAPGKKPFSARVVSPEREATVVDVVLDDEVPPTPTAAPRPAPPPETPAPRPPSPARRGGSGRTAAIATTAGAIVMAGAGIGAFVAAGAKQSDGQGACATRTAGCDDLRGPVRTWDALALGAWIAAGALGTVAVVLWALPADGRAASLRVGPEGARVVGTF
jgi:hypothetical protein